MDGSDTLQPRSPYIRSRGLKIPRHPELTTRRIRGALREGDTVLELGGGIGYMSTLLSVKKKVARVVSYEANPTLIPYIHSVHAANEVTNVEVRNALLSPRAGKPVPFYIRKNFLGSSMDGEIDKQAIIDTVQIDKHGISPTLKEVQPNVLVCDIEGAEADLLPAGDWSGLRVAIIELHPQWTGQSGVQAVFDCMQKAGLSYFPKASEAKVVTFMKGW